MSAFCMMVRNYSVWLNFRVLAGWVQSRVTKCCCEEQPSYEVTKFTVKVTINAVDLRL